MTTENCSKNKIEGQVSDSSLDEKCEKNEDDINRHEWVKQFSIEKNERNFESPNKKNRNHTRNDLTNKLVYSISS